MNIYIYIYIYVYVIYIDKVRRRRTNPGAASSAAGSTSFAMSAVWSVRMSDSVLGAAPASNASCNFR